MGVGSKSDYDFVLAAVIDENTGGSRCMFWLFGKIRIYTFRCVKILGYIRKGIAANGADEAGRDAGASCGNRLIGSFSARTREKFTDKRLSRVWELRYSKSQVLDITADNNDG